MTYADHSSCSQCRKSLLTVKSKVMAIRDKHGCSIRICGQCFEKSATAQNAYFLKERRF